MQPVFHMQYLEEGLEPLARTNLKDEHRSYGCISSINMLKMHGASCLYRYSVHIVSLAAICMIYAGHSQS